MKNLGLVMLLAAALFAVVVDGRGRVGRVRFGGYTGGGGGGRGGGNGWTWAWYQCLAVAICILIGLYLIIEAIKYCCCKKEEKKEKGEEEEEEEGTSSMWGTMYRV